jgi:hypothetical protein
LAKSVNRSHDLGIATARRQHPGTEEAGLPVVQQRGDEQLLGDLLQVEIRIVEDDRRGLATEFQGDRTQQPPADLADRLTGRGGSGETDLVDAGVRHQMGAHLAPGGHDVDHPVGDAGLGDALGEDVGVQHRLG